MTNFDPTITFEGQALRFSPETTSMQTEKPSFKNNTYEIVSKIAYLIGVPKKVFDASAEPPKPEIYKQLDLDKNARIIRHLCILRTAIERNYKSIRDTMRTDFRSILSMPEYVPTESIMQLNTDCVPFYKKTHTHPNQHIIEINRIISDRINNCKSLFPLWLNWHYIRELFVMPDGLTESGIRAAADQYYADMQYYPYQLYINWPPSDEGNILYNDEKFITLLYRWHHDRFDDYSKVSDAGNIIKNNIYDYIAESQKMVVVVDCENSDPYKLCATFKNLNAEYTAKISRIILFDDIHSAAAWRILESFTHVPVEHVMINRVKSNKSLVDIRLTARACQEHYQNQIDSFIVVSSDSDYWGLISALPEARFLVMIEREKCSPVMKTALKESGIFYCYIDDFYSANAEDIKQEALFRELRRHLDNAIQLNVHEMFKDALHTTRLTMSQAEQRQFYEKHIKGMFLIIDDDGNVHLELKKK